MILVLYIMGMIINIIVVIFLVTFSMKYITNIHLSFGSFMTSIENILIFMKCNIIMND